MKAADCTAGLAAMEERRVEVPSLRAEAMVKSGGGWSGSSKTKDGERGREEEKERRKRNNIREVNPGGKKSRSSSSLAVAHVFSI